MAGKIWAVIREVLEWMAGTLHIALSHKKGYPAHVLMLNFGLKFYV
jgi:hypothetical protein